MDYIIRKKFKKMKKTILTCTGLLIITTLFSQEELVNDISAVDKKNIAIRPNSRDYSMIRLGNNDQRMIQIRHQAMIRHKKAMNNRKQVMQRKRELIMVRSARQRRMQQQRLEQRRLQQQRIEQRRRMIQHHQRMNNR